MTNEVLKNSVQNRKRNVFKILEHLLEPYNELFYYIICVLKQKLEDTLISTFKYLGKLNIKHIELFACWVILHTFSCLLIFFKKKACRTFFQEYKKGVKVETYTLDPLV